MGFGTLFLGYVLLFICRGVDIFPDIFAYALMFWGLRTISVHSGYFAKSKISIYPLATVGLVNDILQITAAFAHISFGILQQIVSGLNGLCLLVFHYFLLKAVEAISAELELRKMAARARRNLTITFVYCIISLVVTIRPPFMEDAMRYISLPVLLLGLAWIVLNAKLIYSCYMYICLEGDEDMETENPGLLARMIFRNKDKKTEETKKSRSGKKKKRSGK